MSLYQCFSVFRFVIARQTRVITKNNKQLNKNINILSKDKSSRVEK